MTRAETFCEISRLASGTLANLFRLASYNDLERAQTVWMAWVIDQPDGTAFETWQDAWLAYQAAKECRIK